MPSRSELPQQHNEPQGNKRGRKSKIDILYEDFDTGPLEANYILEKYFPQDMDPITKKRQFNKLISEERRRANKDGYLILSLTPNNLGPFIKTKLTEAQLEVSRYLAQTREEGSPEIGGSSDLIDSGIKVEPKPEEPPLSPEEVKERLTDLGLIEKPKEEKPEEQIGEAEKLRRIAIMALDWDKEKKGGLEDYADTRPPLSERYPLKLCENLTFLVAQYSRYTDKIPLPDAKIALLSAPSSPSHRAAIQTLTNEEASSLLVKKMREIVEKAWEGKKTTAQIATNIEALRRLPLSLPELLHLFYTRYNVEIPKADRETIKESQLTPTRQKEDPYKGTSVKG